MFQIQFLHINICFQYDLDLFARTRLKYLCAHCIVWNLSNPNLLPFPTPMCPKGTGIGAKHSFKKRNWGNTFFCTDTIFISGYWIHFLHYYCFHFGILNTFFCTATIFILGYWMLKNATAVDIFLKAKIAFKTKRFTQMGVDCRLCLLKILFAQVYPWPWTSLFHLQYILWEGAK